jgi:hypothetical protein
MHFVHVPFYQPGLEAWRSQRGFWSFVILHETMPGKRFICSYRDQRVPIVRVALTHANSTAVLFDLSTELKNQPHVPTSFGFISIDDAIRACEVKYKDLLIR